MSDTYVDIGLQAVLRPILGKPCWQARQGYSSFITCEFGEPQLNTYHRPDRSGNKEKRRRIRVAGSHHLWIEQCEWWIYENDEILANSESSDEVIADAVDRIDSQIFESADILNTTGCCTFRFEGGLEIRMTPYEEEFPDTSLCIWHLYGPELVYSFHASGKFSREAQ